MTSESLLANSYPPELLSVICGYVYAAGLPPPVPCLDPPAHSEGGVPTFLPSSYPAAYWSQDVVRRTLLNLTRVNRAWYGAAKPWLWHKVEVRLPRSWLSLVEEVAGGDEDEIDPEQAATVVGETIQVVEDATLSARNIMGGMTDKELHERVLEKLSGLDGSIPPELLTPLASRDPSPRRLRPKSKSPARWKLMRSISVAIQDVMEHDNPGVYVPAPDDPRPGRLTRHLDFNHFRTIGMRRSVEEGVNNRFVTGERLEAVLKELSGLLAFGATEYMDGALTLSVLTELLLRGYASHGRGRPSRGRDPVFFDPKDTEAEDRERRREYKELEALDLTGCVSAVFVNALTQFVNDHFIDHSELPSSGNEDEGENERGRPKSRSVVRYEPLVFLSLQRLCLRGVKSVQAQILNPLVLAFPSLTHLDLSCTRVTPDLLQALGTSPTIHLQSLALERCNWLTGESIREFLVEAPAAQGIRELSLYGDLTFPSPLSEDELHNIFAHAPCFRTGALAYLDLSSAPVTSALLCDVCAPQPQLRSLGLSHIRNLELSAVADFLRTKAVNVEVLTLVTSSQDLGYGAEAVSARQASIALHAQIIRPLCTPPFSCNLSSSSKEKSAEPPTRLRVVELATPLLATVGSGAGSWRVIKSKGGRGWYVDVASGWVVKSPPSSCGAHSSILRRDLEQDHPWRIELERLADANGNVSSGIGWHARKMEVLQGHGLLGREAGLYGAVSFAYQG
ncbi:hypothetical protein BKA93DRAFT_741621 [Sparassis latifolia]